MPATAVVAVSDGITRIAGEIAQLEKETVRARTHGIEQGRFPVFYQDIKSGRRSSGLGGRGADETGEAFDDFCIARRDGELSEVERHHRRGGAEKALPRIFGLWRKRDRVGEEEQ